MSASTPAPDALDGQSVMPSPPSPLSSISFDFIIRAALAAGRYEDAARVASIAERGGLPMDPLKVSLDAFRDVVAVLVRRFAKSEADLRTALGQVKIAAAVLGFGEALAEAIQVVEIREGDVAPPAASPPPSST